MAPLSRQDENIYRTDLMPVNPPGSALEDIGVRLSGRRES
jgi:hypothetical protein